MVILRRIQRLCAGLLLLMLLILGLQPVIAQEGGQGLEISPPATEISLDPGKSTTTVIKLRNVTTGTLIVKAEVNDFVAEGESGVAKPLLNPGERSSFTLKEYVSAIPEQKIAPGEQKNINVTINLPANASPGGHYGIVRFTGTPESSASTGVSLSASIGTLVLLRVPGDVRENLSVEEFSVTSKGKKLSVFSSGPVEFIERLKNSGNVHLKPQGEIKVTNIFGQEVGAVKVNGEGGNVLPASIRKFSQSWNKKPLFGRYTANLNVRFDGQSGCLVTDSVTFWVIPYKLVGIALALILILLIIIKLLKHRSGHRDVGSSLDNDVGNSPQPGPFDDDGQIPPSIPTNPQL